MRAGTSLRLAVAIMLTGCSGRTTLEPARQAQLQPAIAPARREKPAVAEDEMVRVPAGTFTRGHDHPSRADESPPHLVSIHSFWFDRTLVTRAAFSRFVEATGYVTEAEKAGYGMASREGMKDWEWERVPHGSWRKPFITREFAPGEPVSDEAEKAFLRDDAPVVMVTFADAVAYCSHQSKRLPTEAEWEYAMRAGSSGTRYPWGDSPEREGVLSLNFWQGESHHQNLRQDGYVYVSPVRAFLPNAWGIYDPVGNVWQWTADWYARIPTLWRRERVRPSTRLDP